MRLRYRKTFIVCAFAGLGGLCGLASAETVPGDRRISVDVVGVPAEEVFRSLAEELGSRLIFDSELKGSLSLRLDNVRVSTALDAACDSLGCTYVVVKGDKPRLHVNLSRTEEARGRGLVTDTVVTDRSLTPVTLSLKEAALGDVMRTFAKILGCDLKMEADASIPLTIELENMTVSAALERIGDLLDVQSFIIPGGSPPDCQLKLVADSR